MKIAQKAVNINLKIKLGVKDMIVLVAHKNGNTYRKHFKHHSVALVVLKKLKDEGFEVHIYKIDKENK